MAKFQLRIKHQVDSSSVYKAGYSWPVYKDCRFSRAKSTSSVFFPTVGRVKGVSPEARIDFTLEETETSPLF